MQSKNQADHLYNSTRTISTTVQSKSIWSRWALWHGGLTTNTTVLNYVHSWIKNTPAVADCSRCQKINAYHASNSKVVKAYGNLGSFPSFGTEVSLDNPPSSDKRKIKWIRARTHVLYDVLWSWGSVSHAWYNATWKYYTASASKIKEFIFSSAHDSEVLAGRSLTVRAR